MGGGRVLLALQRATDAARSPRRWFRMTARLARRGRRAPAGRRLRALRGTAQLHTGAPRLRQPDCDRLLRRTRAVLAFADVMDLFAHELAGLRRGRLALPFVA